jgi:AraC-like DNA-binding protein
MRRHGLDVLALARRTRVLEGNATRAAAQLPAEIMARFFEEGAALAGDPHVGLHAAIHWPRRDAGLVVLAPPCAPALGDAVDFVAKYFALVHGWSRVELRRAGEGARLVFEDDEEVRPCAIVTEFEVALAASALRGAAEPRWCPRRVTFRHATTVKTMDFPGAGQPEFGASSTVIEIDAKELAEPSPRADPHLFDYLGDQAARALEQVRVTLVPSFIRERLDRLIGLQAPSIGRLAAGLHMSARTLQRRLEQGGTSYQAVLDAARNQKAAGLLETTELSIAEIAKLLGYSTPRAFLRAFERWTGTTPTSFRRRNDVLHARD